MILGFEHIFIAGISLDKFIASLILLYLIVGLILRSRKPRIPIWALLASSSFMVVVSGLTSIDEIEKAVDLNVVLFLIGMFSLVSLAESSGLLAAVSHIFISRFKSRYSLIYASALMFGFLSAFTVNDTVAVMGPPIARLICKIVRIQPEFMFLLLAYSITIGSVMTPLGNPQNVLIATQSGIKAPFILFIKYLFIPTIINLLVTAYLLIRIYRVGNGEINSVLIPREAIVSRRDAALSGIGLLLVVTALIVNDVLALNCLPHVGRIGFIPFVIAAFTYMFASDPRKTLRHVDWGSIMFFICMFITMDGIWRSGVLQLPLSQIFPGKTDGFQGIIIISATSIVFSQILSNVPFTKVFIDYMRNIGYSGNDEEAWIALAMSSTIAGNTTVLGAASNIIVIEVLESRFKHTISFTRFLKIGVIATVINISIYILYMLTINPYQITNIL